MYCSNCEDTLDDCVENDSFEIDYEEEVDRKSGQIVTVLEAVSLIFNRSDLIDMMSQAKSIPMCQNCLLVLSDLYLIFTRFKKLSTKTSHLQQLLLQPSSALVSSHLVAPVDQVNDTNMPSSQMTPPSVVHKTEVKQEHDDVEHEDDNWILPEVQLSADEDSQWTEGEGRAEASSRRANRVRKPVVSTRKSKLQGMKARNSRVSDRKARNGNIKKAKAKGSHRRLHSKSTSSATKLGKMNMFKCEECPKKFTSAESLHGHEQSCHNPDSKPFVCTLCDPVQRFKLHWNFKAHQRNKHDIQDSVISSESFSCSSDGCSKVFKSGRRFAAHLKLVHNEIAKFDCTMCSKSFLIHKSLVSHSKAIHLGYTMEEQERNRCTVCSKVCASKSRLKFHLERVHRVHEATQCSECNKVFQNRYVFECHLKRHAEEAETAGQTYTCTECDKTYKSRQSLKNHIDSLHLRTKDIVCDVCGYRTNCLKQFQNHQEQHDPTRVKKYPCDVCNLLFYSPRDVQRHSIKHQPANHCICNYCGMSLTQTSLKRHIEARHREIAEVSQKVKVKVHPCPICGKTFKIREYLTQHLRSKSHGGTGLHQNQKLKKAGTPRAKSRESQGQVATSPPHPPAYPNFDHGIPHFNPFHSSLPY